MIPHRTLRNEINATGLRERVTACRKRLRGSRETQRTLALNEGCELFAEAESATAAPRSDFKDVEMRSLEEHEVGIT